ncbi:MAG: hypothetical protein HY904_09450 [Deltaproteobacteria bacterium]|nr:hypothetical protein [Deltaproteobacteria bacterium]
MRRFHCLLSREPRPDAGRLIAVDGARDPMLLAGRDVELGHWRGHRTPQAWRADTATGAALRYVSERNADEGDVALTGHMAVDAILAAFVLVQPELALNHGTNLALCSEVGDFWSWASPEVLVLYEAVNRRMRRGLREKEDANSVCRGCFGVVERYLGGLGRDDSEAREAVELLNAQVALVEDGGIQRRVPTERLATYLLPASVVSTRLAEALFIPQFDAPLRDGALLSPRVRARLDAQRVVLVSVEAQGGWFHDVWFPGHAWAEAPSLWTPPGISRGTADHELRFHLPELARAADGLQAEERNPVFWAVPEKVYPFQGPAKRGRKFPVVTSVLSEALEPSPSSLHPQRVAAALQAVFA